MLSSTLTIQLGTARFMMMMVSSLLASLLIPRISLTNGVGPLLTSTAGLWPGSLTASYWCWLPSYRFLEAFLWRTTNVSEISLIKLVGEVSGYFPLSGDSSAISAGLAILLCTHPEMPPLALTWIVRNSTHGGLLWRLMTASTRPGLVFSCTY